MGLLVEWLHNWMRVFGPLMLAVLTGARGGSVQL